jgi:hypothetical protein
MHDSEWNYIKYLLLINRMLEKVVHREDVNILYSLINFEIVSFLKIIWYHKESRIIVKMIG